jgi:hypothetical protein
MNDNKDSSSHGKRRPREIKASCAFQTDAAGARTLRIHAIENGDFPSVVGEATISFSNAATADCLFNGFREALLEEHFGMPEGALRKEVIEIVNRLVTRRPVLKLARKPEARVKENSTPGPFQRQEVGTN